MATKNMSQREAAAYVVKKHPSCGFSETALRRQLQRHLSRKEKGFGNVNIDARHTLTEVEERAVVLLCIGLYCDRKAIPQSKLLQIISIWKNKGRKWATSSAGNKYMNQLIKKYDALSFYEREPCTPARVNFDIHFCGMFRDIFDEAVKEKSFHGEHQVKIRSFFHSSFYFHFFFFSYISLPSYLSFLLCSFSTWTKLFCA